MSGTNVEPIAASETLKTGAELFWQKLSLNKKQFYKSKITVADSGEKTISRVAYILEPILSRLKDYPVN